MRGEQWSMFSSISLYLGSPPLARGTVMELDPKYCDVRITPACAGNRVLPFSIFGSAKDHPRLRGEQGACRPCFIVALGSPPLARGTVCRGSRPPSIRRITPACAGNRISVRPVSLFIRDHPRLRGEQLRRTHFSRSARGSPPLARGTDEAAEGGSKDAGITPACAGNSASIYAQILHARDHPRLRGEQLCISTALIIFLGSPPLARGTGEPRRTYCRGSGITPACAGNSCIISVSATAARDHPRLRGEQKSSATKSSGSAGSPPLARGTGIISSFSFSFARITPACAGNR